MRPCMVISAMGICLCLMGTTSMAQTPAKDDAARKEQRAKIIRDVVSKWQGIFGPVNFDDPTIFTCMVYLHPKPTSEFLLLDDKKLSNRLTFSHSFWMDLFFKGAFHDAVVKIPATKYYLKGKYQLGKAESDLLLYQEKYGDESIRMMESLNVCLVTIRPKDYQPEKGLDVKYISGILFDRVRLKYPTIEKLNRAFDLRGTATVGNLFISTKLEGKQVALISDWTDCVFVFAGKDGLSLFLFKAQAGRAAVGLPSDFNWLKKELYEKDGKTLVASPPGEKE